MKIEKIDEYTGPLPSSSWDLMNNLTGRSAIHYMICRGNRCILDISEGRVCTGASAGTGNNNNADVFLGMIALKPDQANDEFVHSFYKWLFEESFWAPVFYGPLPELNKRNQYVFKARTDIPVGYMIGGLIAIRTHRERPDLFPVMEEMVKAGFTMDLAFILCHEYKIEGGKLVTGTQHNSCHSAFSLPTSKIRQLHKFLLKEFPSILDTYSTYQENPRLHEGGGVHKIWSKGPSRTLLQVIERMGKTEVVRKRDTWGGMREKRITTLDLDTALQWQEELYNAKD